MGHGFRAAAVGGAVLWLLTGCGGGSEGALPERVDSAGVVLVTNSGEDRPLGWRFEPDLTLGGEDFYRVHRWNVGVDGRGVIHVLDGDGKRVLRYGPGGAALEPLGRPGSGPGELEWPVRLEVAPDGVVRVHDIGRGVVVRWDSAGEWLGEDPVRDVGGGASRTLRDGRIVEADEYGGEVSASRLLLIRPAGDTVELARVEWQGRPIQLESCGMRFSGMPPVFTPELRWDAAGDRVALVDDAGYDIRVRVHGQGERRLRRRLEPRRSSTELAVAEIGEGMRVMTSGGERICRSEEVVEQRGVAPLVPRIERVTVEPGGRVWAQRFVAGDEPGPIDVFAPDGEYLGTLDPSTPFPIGFTPDGRAMVSDRDEFDVERLLVGRYREAGEGSMTG